MLRPALTIAYDVKTRPMSDPMLPRVLETLTIVFLRLFSTREMNACETYAGPTRFVWKTSLRSSILHEKALSSPPGFCARIRKGR